MKAKKTSRNAARGSFFPQKKRAIEKKAGKNK
jgi:hypothetical protein